MGYCMIMKVIKNVRKCLKQLLFITGSQEVDSSILFSSTKKNMDLGDKLESFFFVLC
jgi:hypothetical protein